MYCLFLEVPAIIQRFLHCTRGKWATNKRRTSLSLADTTILSLLQLTAWRTSLKSASSWVAIKGVTSADWIDDRTSVSSFQNHQPQQFPCQQGRWREAHSIKTVQDQPCWKVKPRSLTSSLAKEHYHSQWYAYWQSRSSALWSCAGFDRLFTISVEHNIYPLIFRRWLPWQPARWFSQNLFIKLQLLNISTYLIIII